MTHGALKLSLLLQLLLKRGLLARGKTGFTSAAHPCSRIFFRAPPLNGRTECFLWDQRTIRPTYTSHLNILAKPSRQERSRNTWKEIGKETPSPRFTSSCSRNGAASEVKREQVRSSEIKRETKRDCWTSTSMESWCWGGWKPEWETKKERGHRCSFSACFSRQTTPPANWRFKIKMNLTLPDICSYNQRNKTFIKLYRLAHCPHF